MNYILNVERLEILSHSDENQKYSGDLIAELASSVISLIAHTKNAEARIAEAIELLEAKQGEWLPVISDYTPEWVDGIREVIAILRPEQPDEEIQVTPERLDPSMDGLDYE